MPIFGKKRATQDQAPPTPATPTLGGHRLNPRVVANVAAPPGAVASEQSKLLKPQTGMLSPTTGRHVPPNKPIPPVPAALRPSPDKPPPTKGPHKPPDKPIPPAPGDTVRAALDHPGPAPDANVWRAQQAQVDKERQPGLSDEAIQDVGADLDRMGQGLISEKRKREFVTERRGIEAEANLAIPKKAYTRWTPGSPTDRASGEEKYKRGLGGSANRVDVIDYQHEIADSKSKKGFFKPEPRANPQTGRYDLPDAAGTVGIDDAKAPRMAARAVASSRLDQRLGLNLLAREQHGKHGKEVGNLSARVPGRETVTNLYELNSEQTNPNAPLRPSMEKAEGGQRLQMSRQRYNKFDMKKPGIQKGMNDLQWMDAISAQGDRHGGNIFIDDSTPEGSVHGIDNDLAWGTRGLGQKGTYDIDADFAGNLGVPSQVDQGTAQSILALKASDLEKILNAKEKDSGRKLTSAEINAAKIRLQAVQARLKQMMKTGGVVREWNDETYQRALAEGGRRNYMARNREDYEAGMARDARFGEQGIFAER